MAKVASMGVRMPDDIASDPIQAEIWANIAPENNRFKSSDIPALRLLVYWHAVAKTAEDAMHGADGRLGVFDKIGVKPFKTPDGQSIPLMRKSPALTVLKEASAEIRLLSDMLGISPASKTPVPVEVRTSKNAAVLQMAFDERSKRAKKAAGA